MNPADCLKTRPQSVALVGLGASRMMLTEEMCGTKLETHFDETWTVNFGGKIYCHDKLWVMDDIRGQAKAMPAYGRFLQNHDKPIIVSTAYPEFPMAVEFPIKEVVEKLGDDFLNSTVAYAIAWAMVTGVKELTLYGCDFHYPNVTRREEGGQCAAYLLGLARHFGMKFRVPQNTTLLGAYHSQVVGNKCLRPLYGYAIQPFIPSVGSADGNVTQEVPNVVDAGSQECPQVPALAGDHTDGPR